METKLYQSIIWKYRAMRGLNMDEGPLKKKEPTDRGTLPCGICDQKVGRRKYQSHWLRCFQTKEKNSAKVEGLHT